jgi:PPOX class probable F420-dependent enzyme
VIFLCRKKEKSMPSTSVTGDMTPAFRALFSAEYMNLITFRKNGTPVATPIWGAEQNGIIYVETGADSGKVKRIRHNPHVTLSPCTARGKVTGEIAEGYARIVDTTAEEYVVKGALQRKYGLKRQLFYFFSGLIHFMRRQPQEKTAYLAIEPHSHHHDHNHKHE